ncbi:uncharacterized protein LOC123547699 isoform X2 [Mercenaria mercenaria]|uniref:uncharacterized protein LOC123547699 isoform X2 n=1 Tax=Mercenaria mercenaria TaxID=6596 RepID=UPI00234E8A4D|nr:uncharacterized protein LOC123547699 isoform X2 [Mercenaria mercenaria]
MKFVCLCILLAASFAVLNGATTQLKEQAKEVQTAKRDLLATKLRELLKSAKAEENKEEKRENADTELQKNTQDVNENPTGSEVPANRQNTARGLKSTRNRQRSASARKELNRSPGKMTLALRKRISDVASGKLQTATEKKQMGRNLLNRKYGAAGKGQAQSLGTATRQRSPNKRIASQKKRQYPGYASNYLTCDYCKSMYGDYNSDNYPSTPDYSESYYYQTTPSTPPPTFWTGWSSYQDTPTPYNTDGYPYPNDYQQDEWSICNEMLYVNNTCCDAPCQDEYDDGFFMCFIAEVYSINQELEGWSMDMSYIDELHCQLGKLMEELSYRLSDPYMTTYYPYKK